ncbi:MAG: hypothetical protein KKG00_04490 [Bacteroidetes bacterium]|nr:hypothetical protein [Bacteroidota bacterium]
MAALQKITSVQREETLDRLEEEIRELEAELRQVQQQINAFTQLIRHHLAGQIRTLNELTDLYKAQKKAKKEKRQEQKKRGKHYREPVFAVADRPPHAMVMRAAPEGAHELKRLYKEAIVRVHPDKFAGSDEKTADRATEVTTQLITLYQAGELDALRDYHEYILSGNAMAYTPFMPEKTPDPQSMRLFLQKKRDELRLQLHGLRSSRLYEVLTTYDEPAHFVEELRSVYAERIETFRKRTRTKATG